MNSTVEVTLVTTSEARARAGFAALHAEVERLESILSDYRPAANVSRLNHRLTDELAPETRLLLQRAQAVCHATDGAFDVSIRPVKQLWGFGAGLEMHVPDSSAVRAALAHVGCDVFEITPAGRFVWRDPQAEIDLGGIAQGFVARCCADTLRARGIDSFLIDISGDIVAAGRRSDGARWRVGVQNPRQPDSLVARLTLDTAAITTAGDYEQYFIADGKRYHHIFDPSTGRPADNGIASVTVLADDPIAADSYDNAVFVLGPERGLALLDQRSDLRGFLVTEPRPGTLRLLWSDGRNDAHP